MVFTFIMWLNMFSLLLFMPEFSFLPSFLNFPMLLTFYLIDFIQLE